MSQVQLNDLRGSKLREFNVVDYGAKGDGLTNDTAAILRALTAVAGGGVLNFPEGTFIVASTLTLPDGVIVRGAGQTLNNSAWTTMIRFTSASTPLFNITGSGCMVEGVFLYQDPGVTALTGNIGIKVASTAVATEIHYVQAVGFYDGLDLQCGGGQTNLTTVTAQSCQNIGIISRNAQGYWMCVNAEQNKSHGIYMTTGVGGSQPWIGSGATFNNGGYGIKCDYVGFTGLCNFFLNNDCLGEIYLDAASTDCGQISNCQIQWAGLPHPAYLLTVSDATAGAGGTVRITFTTAHGLTTGDTISIACVYGVPMANCVTTITTVAGQPTKIDLDGTVFAGTYVSGGYGRARIIGGVAQTFPLTADAPGIYVSAASGPIRILNNSVFSSNGVGIESYAPFTKVYDNYLVGCGQGFLRTGAVGMKLNGGYAVVMGNTSNTASEVSNNYSTVVGNYFENSAPAVTWAVSDTTLTKIVVLTNVGTATTVNPHGLKAGDVVVVAGCAADAELNGNKKVTSTPTTKTFTFATVSVSDATYTDATLTVATVKCGLNVASGAPFVLTGNHIIWGSGTALNIASGVELIGGSNMVIGTTVDGSTRSAYAREIGGLVGKITSQSHLAQSAAISTGGLLASVDAATYRVTAYLHTVTAAGGVLTSDVKIGWTYNADAKTSTIISAHDQNVDKNASQASLIFRADAGSDISREVTFSAGAGSVVYDVYFAVERL